MADIYIIYSHKDIDLARKLIDLLSPQWDVWWDDKIVGNFATAIEREMPTAKCVLPIWSSASRESNMVRDELTLAQAHDIQIIPVKFEECSAPYGFGIYSTVDVLGWNGDPDHTGFQQLLRRLASVVTPRSKPARRSTIDGGRVPLPALFLSVSSHETQLVPLEAVKALRLFRAPSILISAYDMIPSRRAKGIISELRRFRAQGGTVLMDSGNYEASRLDDASWCPDDLKSALANTPHDLVFCFDVMKPSSSPSKAVKQIVAAVKRDSKFTKAPVLPIVHAPRLTKGGHLLEAMPAMIREVANQLHPLMIAVPERELGPGLIERVRTVRRIREELDKLPFYQPIHLLGTGNPWSIAVLVAAGADSVDGLEWCRMAVDRENNRLNHFQHFDFFTYQAQLAESLVTVGALGDDKVDFAGRVAFHNLDYYKELSMRLHQAATKGNFEALVTGLLGLANTGQLSREIPELFQ